ncbi:MAG: Mur ligase family protein [Gemmatimonadota bacterium]
MGHDGLVLTTVEPNKVRRIHLVGVAGTGMGAFAGMLKSLGYVVTGSDENVYPPMSDMLREWGIDVFTPYSPPNIDRARPDLVIIGNVIRRVNVEAEAVRERRIPQMSFPAAFGSLVVGDRHSVVIVGTHGKTTTSALMAHVLAHAGRDPTFLVGGVTLNYNANYRIGRGEYVVVEGDEYDTAYWDKGPKFMHYRARTALLTSIEFDHADIYRDMPHYESAYERFCTTIPPDGFLGVSATYPRAVAIARQHCTGRVATYAVDADADYRAIDVRFSEEGARFTVMDGDATHLLLPMSGRQNVENALGVYAAARALGLSPNDIGDGLATFRGVKRRQEPRGEISGVLVIDDFAHHPTAVRETIAGIKQRYPARRLWAVFEPRSNTSRRNIHQVEYAAAFDHADLVTIRVPEPHDKVPADQQLNVNAIVKDLSERGIAATALSDVAEITQLVSANAKPNDVILIMSNGAFGGLIPALLQALGGQTTSAPQP